MQPGVEKPVLRDAGYRGGAFGPPTFEVNGRMLPNNPPLATVLEHLQVEGGVSRSLSRPA